MSHFTTIKLDNSMLSETVLLKALEKLGFINCSYHETPVNLQDYYQIRGKQAKSFQQAEIVIPWQENHLYSDAGFSKMETGGYALVSDSLDKYKLNQKLEDLPQVYSEILVENQIEVIREQVKKLNNRGEAIITQVKQGTNTKLVITFTKDIEKNRKKVAQTRY